jgi:branched-chain amino acid transport system ATP-binding protein
MRADVAAPAEGLPVCLEVDDLHKNFGGVRAVQGATFSVARGSITGLVGPNGAGKSTAINLISGLVKPDRGVVRLNGQRIDGHNLEWVSRRGLVRTFQVAREWPALSVMENVIAAAPAGHRETIWRALFARRGLHQQERLLEIRAAELLARLKLAPLATEQAGKLSGGQKRLLEFARVAMASPTIVLLDEPLAGVNPVLAEELRAAITDLRDQGVTVLIVEHNLRFVERTCDHVIVMGAGRVIGEGTMRDLRRNQQVVEAYLGQGATHA